MAALCIQRGLKKGLFLRHGISSQADDFELLRGRTGEALLKSVEL